MLAIANIWGWILSHKRLVLYAAVALALVIVFGIVWRSCKSSPKLDEKAIIKAQQAIAKQDHEEMVKILAESDAKEAGLDDTIKGAEAATREAAKNYSGLSNDDLAAELNRRAKE